MSLLDAKVAQWDHWSIRLAAKLDKSFFIVLSGAWQSAYTVAFRIHSLLGGDWTNLSIADTFLEENHLPPELLNRVSTNVIEVLPPSREELAGMILRVQRDLGVEVTEREAQIPSYLGQQWVALDCFVLGSSVGPVLIMSKDTRTSAFPGWLRTVLQLTQQPTTT